jgi:ABC-type proline/glycine betaine transport system permease subunit
MFPGLAEIIIAFIITGAIIFAIYLLLRILYTYTLYRALRTTEQYHSTVPALAWLLLIPVFSLIWQFYILEKITQGIKGKFNANGRECGDAAYGIGLAWCILGCVNFIPYLNFLTLLPYIGVWIIYWVKIKDFNHEMEMMLL